MNNAVRILAILAVVFFCIQVFSDNKADVDLWGNVGFVTAMPWSQEFKYANTFSFTEPHHPWVNHEWLAQYIFHSVHARYGNPGLLILKVIIGLCIVAMIYFAMSKSCKSGTVKFLCLLLVISTMGYGFSTRPHLFTYMLYTFFLLVLWREKIFNAGYRFLIPFLGIIWVNIHGAFFIGIFILILYVILEAIKKFYYDKGNHSLRHITPVITTIILLIGASFLNPYGFRLWTFIFRSLSEPRPYLSEWAPLNRLAYLNEHPDFIALSLFAFIAVRLSKRPKDITWLGILFILFSSAVIMRRNIPLFAITAGFVAPQYIEDTAGEPLKRLTGRFSKHVLGAILVIFIAVSTRYTLFFNKTNPLEIEVPQDSFPVSAISFMKENDISGNALVFFDWAEYCIWKLYPDCKVFLDGRFLSAYSLKTIRDYFDFLYLNKDWENALKDYPTDIIIIHRLNPVYERMLSRPDWILILKDDIAALFLKKSTHKRLLDSFQNENVMFPGKGRQEYFP